MTTTTKPAAEACPAPCLELAAPAAASLADVASAIRAFALVSHHASGCEWPMRACSCGRDVAMTAMWRQFYRYESAQFYSRIGGKP